VAGELTIKLPDALEAGVYAKKANVWHTPSEFTLDFLTVPVHVDAQELARVVSRVKIPAIFVFDLIRELNAEMTAYEREFGEIRRVEHRADEDSEEE
jgi:hypothetical protein